MMNLLSALTPQVTGTNGLSGKPGSKEDAAEDQPAFAALLTVFTQSDRPLQNTPFHFSVGGGETSSDPVPDTAPLLVGEAPEEAIAAAPQLLGSQAAPASAGVDTAVASRGLPATSAQATLMSAAVAVAPPAQSVIDGAQNRPATAASLSAGPASAEAPAVAQTDTPLRVALSTIGVRSRLAAAPAALLAPAGSKPPAQAPVTPQASVPAPPQSTNPPSQPTATASTTAQVPAEGGQPTAAPPAARPILSPQTVAVQAVTPSVTAERMPPQPVSPGTPPGVTAGVQPATPLPAASNGPAMIPAQAAPQDGTPQPDQTTAKAAVQFAVPQPAQQGVVDIVSGPERAISQNASAPVGPAADGQTLKSGEALLRPADALRASPVVAVSDAAGGGAGFNTQRPPTAPQSVQIAEPKTAAAFPTLTAGVATPETAQPHAAAIDRLPEAAAASVRPAPPTEDAMPKQATKPFAASVLAQVKSVSSESGRTVFNLQPSGLGALEVEVIADKDIAAKVVLRVENPMVLQAFREDRQMLAQSLGMSDSTQFEFHEQTSHSDRKNGHAKGRSTSDEGAFGSGESAVAERKHDDLIADGAVNILT